MNHFKFYKNAILFIFFTSIGFLPNQSCAQVTTISPVTIIGPLKYGLRNYRYYMDEVLNFELKFPQDLLFKTAQNKFFTKDNQLIMSVWRKNVSEGLDWNTEYMTVLDSFKDSQVTYKIRKNDFFVISGFRGSDVFYRKEINNTTDDGQGFLVFEMSFPKAEKAEWDPILKICANSIEQVHNEKNYLTPVPTWTDEQWGEVVDKHDAANETYLEEELKTREQQKLNPVSLPIAPNIIKPVPPTNIKLTISNGMAYISWERVDIKDAYCIYFPDSPRGFSDEIDMAGERRTFIHEPKFFVGYAVTLKQQSVHYYGIETISSKRGCSAIAIYSVEPKDVDEK